jgi:hypothetical protein
MTEGGLAGPTKIVYHARPAQRRALFFFAHGTSGTVMTTKKKQGVRAAPPRNFVAKHHALLPRRAGAHRDDKYDYRRRERNQVPLIRKRDDSHRPVLIHAA